MPRAELDQILVKVAEGLEKEFQFRNDWQGDVINFKRSGLKGTLSIGKSEIEVHIKLSLLAIGFGPAVKSNIVKYMNEVIY